MDRTNYFDSNNTKLMNTKLGMNNIYVCVQHGDEKHNYLFNKIIWKLLIECVIHKAKFIEFSCIEEDKDLIEEIYFNTEDTKEVFSWRTYIEYSDINQEDIMHQISFRGKIIPNTHKLILNNYMGKEQNIKWFYVNLLEEDDDNTVIFSGNHNGQEYYINSVTVEESECIIKIAEENNLFIRID